MLAEQGADGDQGEHFTAPEGHRRKDDREGIKNAEGDVPLQVPVGEGDDCHHHHDNQEDGAAAEIEKWIQETSPNLPFVRNSWDWQRGCFIAHKVLRTALELTTPHESNLFLSYSQSEDRSTLFPEQFESSIREQAVVSPPPEDCISMETGDPESKADQIL